MSYIKYVLLFLLSIICIENNAQVSSFRKASVKTAAKTGIKSAIKSNVKQSGQRAILNEIKESAIKKGLKSAITDRLEHSVNSSIAGEISEKALKEVTENIVKKSVKVSGKKIAKKQATRQLAKGRVYASGKELIEKRVSRYAAKRAKGSTNIAETGFEKAAYDALSPEAAKMKKFFNEEGFKKVESCLPDANSQQKLLKDIQENRTFANLLKERPELIENYAQCLNSSHRTNIKTLRYLNNGADKYADACMFSKRYLRAKDLEFVDNNTKTIVKNRLTGETLGVIDGNVITIPSNDHSLLNMKSMGNMEYHFDNSIYVTDKLGRPVLVKTKINPKFKGTKIYARDKVAQRDFRKGKTNISGLDSERLDDDAGHIIAHDLGGVSDGINLLPQNSSLNKGPFKRKEQTIRKDVNKGAKAEIEIEIIYEKGSASERPDKYIYTYYKNGELHSRTIFDNPQKRRN